MIEIKDENKNVLFCINFMVKVVPNRKELEEKAKQELDSIYSQAFTGMFYWVDLLVTGR